MSWLWACLGNRSRLGDWGIGYWNNALTHPEYHRAALWGCFVASQLVLEGFNKFSALSEWPREPPFLDYSDIKNKIKTAQTIEYSCPHWSALPFLFFLIKIWRKWSRFLHILSGCLFFPPPPSSLGEKGWKIRLPELEQLGGVQGRLMLCSFPSESSQFLFKQPVHFHAGSRMLAVQTLTRLGAQGNKAPSGDQVLFVNIVPRSLQFPNPQSSENLGIFTCHLACRELTWNYLQSLFTCLQHVSLQKY